MPTYEYECKRCSHKFEAFQSMSDDALSKCPECAGKVQRLINGGVGIIFKGSGFYKTDSRGGSKSASSKDSAESNKSDSGTSETSTSETTSSDSGKKEPSSSDAKSEKLGSRK